MSALWGTTRAFPGVLVTFTGDGFDARCTKPASCAGRRSPVARSRVLDTNPASSCRLGFRQRGFTGSIEVHPDRLSTWSSRRPKPRLSPTRSQPRKCQALRHSPLHFSPRPNPAVPRKPLLLAPPYSSRRGLARPPPPSQAPVRPNKAPKQKSRAPRPSALPLADPAYPFCSQSCHNQ